MRSLGALLIVFASAAEAQFPPQPAWSPTARYVTVGQDEPGYRGWYMAAPWRPAQVKGFNDYLTTYGVGNVVPTWQLLRTASAWRDCGGAPFEVAPLAEWPNIVQTLRYVRDRVIPVIGPVEPVSAYRNPALNICAGGANESAHRFMQAIDMVPLRPTSREALIRDLCAVHRREGEPYGVGLGFYAYLRFHIDTRRFRKWGYGSSPEAEQCRREPAPPPPPAPSPVAAPATVLAPPQEAPPPGDAPAGTAVRQPDPLTPR